jgi:hypothetical protein
VLRNRLRSPLSERIIQPLRNYDQLHYLALAASSAVGRAFIAIPRRSPPAPASVGIPIPCRDTKRPYGLIRPHHICSKPRHLCRFICVRHVAIPAFWSPELSGAPEVTSRLQGILFLNRGIPRPYRLNMAPGDYVLAVGSGARVLIPSILKSELTP